jgi:hypothetical protein
MTKPELIRVFAESRSAPVARFLRRFFSPFLAFREPLYRRQR